MKRLNRLASELAREAGVQGATDITGFSLLGHGAEMAAASGVELRFHFDRLPFTRGARGYAAEFIFPGGASDNRLFFGPQVRFTAGLDEAAQMLLFDPQTSGGLLLAVPPENLDALLASAAQAGQPLWVVGEATEGSGVEIV
jgi:selenide,water dikinase